ncbi:MAG: hypothetical protein PHE21_02615 [Candidatus Dojkabacteria bacterium]|nr:hypothetical protein [Candidatus Dojkabacteria bacterium]
MEEKIKNTKIIVNKEDELTDIVSGILEAESERVILTFAEESDILISPINLSVLLETADDENKLLVAQIIKNPTGVRNSSIAGLVTTDSPSGPTEELWEEAQKKKNQRLEPKTIKKEEPKEEVEPESTESGFERKINEAIQKSREEIANKRKDGPVEEDGILLSLDQDIPTENKEPEILIDELPVEDVKKEKVTNIKNPKPKFNPFKNFDIKKLWPFKKGETSSNTSKFKKLLPIIIISLVLVAIISVVIYIQTVPFVKVAIYVEAKEVSIEETFTGDSNITEIDFETLKIPIKTDSVEKDRSSSIKATGKAYKGDKATGKVNLTFVKASCVEVSPINLNSGHVVTTSGKSYSLDSAVSINCNGVPVEASVRAVELGSEYNIESNQFFTVQGYQSTELFGLNGSAFTGGSKQEYTVLAQRDIDSGTDSLKETAIEEARGELEEKGENWEVIGDSVKCDIVKDSVKTSVAVGAAAGDVDLSVKVSCSATYYFVDGLDEGITTLLTEEAVTQNLFDSEDNLELTLSDTIEKTLSIIENTKDSIKIKLIAKGNVMPNVNKEAIANELKGDKWDEGLEYIKSLSFSDKESTASFYPKNFLAKYPFFPKRQGGIIVEIQDL